MREIFQLKHKESLYKFIIPSVLGFIFFVVPVTLGGTTDTIISHSRKLLLTLVGHSGGKVVVPTVALLIFIASLIANIRKPSVVMKDPVLEEALLGGVVPLLIRFTAFVFASAVAFDIVPSFLNGALMLYADNIILHLIPNLLALIIVLSLSVPLLMDFGLVQFTSAFASPLMRPLFLLPGRGAVDLVASLFGGSSISVVISAKMHNRGLYSHREAATMVATFSFCGIYTVYALADILDISGLFVQLLFVSLAISFITALILPRCYPLRSVAHNYVDGSPECFYDDNHKNDGGSKLEYALTRAVCQASHMTVRRYLYESFDVAAPLIFTTIPIMIAVGIPLMVIAEVTPILDVLAQPFVAILSFAGVEEASEIAAATVFSFIEPFVATTYARVLVTTQARFIYLVISVVSMVNILEMGLHVMHSKIPLGFVAMFEIFIIRVFVAIVFIVPIANYFFT